MKRQLRVLVRGIVAEAKRESDGEKEPTYPADHSPIARVPKGGSCCANCKWVSEDKERCGNEHFRRYHGTDELPMPADEMCTDWWERAT